MYTHIMRVNARVNSLPYANFSKISNAFYFNIAGALSTMSTVTKFFHEQHKLYIYRSLFFFLFHTCRLHVLNEQSFFFKRAYSRTAFQEGYVRIIKP